MKHTLGRLTLVMLSLALTGCGLGEPAGQVEREHVRPELVGRRLDDLATTHGVVLSDGGGLDARHAQSVLACASVVPVVIPTEVSINYRL